MLSFIQLTAHCHLVDKLVSVCTVHAPLFSFVHYSFFVGKCFAAVYFIYNIKICLRAFDWYLPQ